MRKIGKKIVLFALFTALFIFASCDPNMGVEIETPATSGSETSTENPTTGGTGSNSANTSQEETFWNDWENMEFLSINDRGVLDTKVAAPWNNRASLTLMSEAVCKDRRKRDGWEMAFSLMNKEGYPDTNYFALYNKYIGTLRIFYYCNVDVAGSGSDFAYDVVFETDSGDFKSFYNSLRYGIPFNTSVNKNVDLLGGGISQTFHVLATPYSEIGMTTLRKGWHAFDIDLSAYSQGKHFVIDGTRLKIACKSVSNSSVSLGTDIIGKIDGDMAATIKKEAVMAKSDGIGGILSNISACLGDTFQSSLASIEAAICGGPFGSMNKYSLWASSAFNMAAKVANYLTGTPDNVPDPELKLTGSFNLKLGATANTNGYITASVSNNVPQVTIRSDSFNPDSHIGEGVWQITNSPVIYVMNNRLLSSNVTASQGDGIFFAQQSWWFEFISVYPSTESESGTIEFDGWRGKVNDLRLPYFYDPTS
ncbi:MAG: hypothetical protein K5839_00105, partial [Treponemataceae bacterium]|nr:hypothetical protein [Treponemataceae bacterium]